MATCRLAKPITSIFSPSAQSTNVHGLDDAFLRDKPVFKKVAQQFIDFIGDAKLVIHNAAFDMKFLNAELKWVGLPPIPWERAIDTLDIARKKFPGSPASLDALCRRYGIDNSSRTLHGALLDSEILADVYLELIGGRQPDLVLAPESTSTTSVETIENWRPTKRPIPLEPLISDEETATHAAFIGAMGEQALWRKLS